MAEDRRSGRDRILDTAAELFYADAFHQVGVDLIVERSGVAKTTLYRHFASKDELIVAWLERANRQFREWFDTAVARRCTPKSRLIGVFEALEKLATSPECLGCTFQVTAAEFPDPTHPGHATAVAHKQAVRDRLRGLAADAGARDPDALGDSLLLLMEGAFAAARMYGPDNPAARVAGAARDLIDGAIPPTGRR